MPEPLHLEGPLAQAPRTRRSRLVRWFAPPLSLLQQLGSRAFDVLTAFVLLLGLSWLWIPRAVLGRLRSGHWFDRQQKVGRWTRMIDQLSFAGALPAGGLATLFNVLRGDLALVGPRALTLAEARRVPPAGHVRFQLRPGLFSPYRLRSGVGMHSEPEEEVDREFFYGETVRGDVALFARSLVNTALAGSAHPEDSPEQFSIFDVQVTNTTLPGAVEWILGQAATERERPATVAFVNPDCLNKAYTDSDYLRVLRHSSVVLPDGIGVHLACRMLGTPLLANTNGTDLFPVLCEEAAKTGQSLFLLGAKPGTAQRAAEEMQRRYPELQIAGVQHGYFDTQEESEVIQKINDAAADVLLIALGAPRQELWAERCAERLDAGVLIGVGGLFDYYSGNVERAPVWVREIGMEWMWRILQEPGRLWRRYLIGNPLFLFRVWRQIQGHPTPSLPGASGTENTK